MQTPAPEDWYDSPLYYDIIFDAGTARESAFLTAVAKCHAPQLKVRKILEPACGSGRLMAALMQQGFAVTGFDASPKMLAFARQRLNALRRGEGAGRCGPPPRLLHQQMQNFAVGDNFDLAHCLVSTFKYLLTEADARAHLSQVAAALRPGGLYVLGFHLSDYDDTRCSRERYFAIRDRLAVTCNIQSWPPERRSRREQVRSRLIVRRGTQTQRLQSVWEFRTYDAAQVRRLLRSVPEFVHLATYDFCYDLGRPRRFDDSQLDNVLILQRRCSPPV